MEGDMQATFDNCNNFNTKLQDTLKGLINANAERKSEIDGLRGDHEALKQVSRMYFNYIQIISYTILSYSEKCVTLFILIFRLMNHSKLVPNEKMICAKMKSNPLKKDAKKTTRLMESNFFSFNSTTF